MRLASFPTRDVDQVFQRFFGPDLSPVGVPVRTVPTDVFHAEDNLVIRMDLPGVRSDDVEVSVQESTLFIKGKRDFPYDAENVRFINRGTVHGEFSQRVTLGKGLNLDGITARFENGVLELTIPYAPEVQPKKIEIQVGTGENGAKELSE